MVVCNDGFKNAGSTIAFIFCLRSSLQWSDPGNCDNLCPSVPNVSNGMVLSGSSVSGDRRQIICSTGVILVGPSSITCSTTNGQWSTPGRCDQIRCSSFPFVQSNAVVSSGSNSPGSSRQVSCRSGYTLKGSNRIFCQSDGTWTQPTCRCLANSNRYSSFEKIICETAFIRNKSKEFRHRP